MGEYEDRYPDAYGRAETTAQPSVAEDHAMTRPPRQSREARPLLDRLGLRHDRPRAWQHAPAAQAPTDTVVPPEPAPVRPAAPTVMPTVAPPRRPVAAVAAAPRAVAPVMPGDTIGNSSTNPGPYRGFGPRGYTRSAERIREDVCDRLTENPFIDASEIDVTVVGSEITLNGTVDSITALNQAQEIAHEVIGVTRVSNLLTVRDHSTTEATPGDAVNAAMPPPRRV